MNEVPSGFIDECERIAAEAQVEKVNTVFLVSREAADFVRSSAHDFLERFKIFDNPLLSGIGDGFFDVPNEKFVGARFSQREMEAINAVALVRLRTIRGFSGFFPQDMTDLYVQVNSSYAAQGGQPCQMYLDFCEEYNSQ